MHKSDLICAVAADLDVTKAQAARVVDSVLSTISKGLAADDKVQIKGFGTFKNEMRAERQGRNPATGEPMTIPAKTVIKFKAH